MPMQTRPGGLTSEEVRSRIEQGLQNGEEEVRTKSVGQILRENLVTPFNLLNLVLAALVLLAGSPKNALFMGVVLCNTVISTFQEIRAKRTIDRLSLIAAPRAHVLRDGQEQIIQVSQIIMDDRMLLTAGRQICADCRILSGRCECNESLITGESDPVEKGPGDLLLSGSFLVSGSCEAQVIHVGEENYAAKISGSAKVLKRPQSEIMTSINRLIKWISIALIPIGSALFLKEVVLSGVPFRESVVSTVAALIGMIPEGLVLLTSVVFAVSVLRLSQHGALVQELYSIETLARVDTLCLDKTGTITEGSMELSALEPLPGFEDAALRQALAAVLAATGDENPTALALREACPTPPAWTAGRTVPFSSARKWSGADFPAEGTWAFGAGEFLLGPGFEPLRDRADRAAAEGRRVLVLAHSPQPLSPDGALPADLRPAALLLLSDKIRPGAAETLAYFDRQGVALKVISGDHPITVSQVAARAGLSQAEKWVDATTLQTEEDIARASREYTVFGRVTPQQKLLLVKALKADGHTVAMTGDGVNDVLALRESDCSVAMASGSDAARTVSQVVLMDSDFAAMPHIVAEGRRGINNLQRSASLFLVKSIFSAVIAVCFLFLTAHYPFEPIQFTLINAVTIGVPSFFLALEPNHERIRGHFLRNIIQRSVPGGMTMVLNLLFLLTFAPLLALSEEQVSTLAVLLTGYTGLMNLLRISIPMNWKRGLLFGAMSAAFLTALVTLQPLFSLVPFTSGMFLLGLLLMITASAVMLLLVHLCNNFFRR